MSELEQRLSMSKRRFVRVFLASAAAYSVPLIASFSMGGLGVGRARAQSFFGPNQSLRDEPPGSGRGFLAANQAPGEPIQRFEDNFPFLGANQDRGRPPLLPD
jgi:hypothetical protein